MLKDSMEHYLECSTQPDFVEDELMYQGFPLGEGLENIGRIRTHEGRPVLLVDDGGGGNGVRRLACWL